MPNKAIPGSQVIKQGIEPGTSGWPTYYKVYAFDDMKCVIEYQERTLADAEENAEMLMQNLEIRRVHIERIMPIIKYVRGR